MTFNPFNLCSKASRFVPDMTTDDNKNGTVNWATDTTDEADSTAGDDTLPTELSFNKFDHYNATDELFVVQCKKCLVKLKAIEWNLKMHLKGKKHKYHKPDQRFKPPVDKLRNFYKFTEYCSTDDPQFLMCKKCKINIGNKTYSLKKHLESTKHKNQFCCVSTAAQPQQHQASLSISDTAEETNDNIYSATIVKGDTMFICTSVDEPLEIADSICERAEEADDAGGGEEGVHADDGERVDADDGEEYDDGDGDDGPSVGVPSDLIARRSKHLAYVFKYVTISDDRLHASCNLCQRIFKFGADRRALASHLHLTHKIAMKLQNISADDPLRKYFTFSADGLSSKCKLCSCKLLMGLRRRNMVNHLASIHHINKSSLHLRGSENM